MFSKIKNIMNQINEKIKKKNILFEKFIIFGIFFYNIIYWITYIKYLKSQNEFKIIEIYFKLCSEKNLNDYVKNKKIYFQKFQ